MKILTALVFLFTGIVSLTASTLLIDDFDSYQTTAELQGNWNSFGVAATAGPPVLHIGEGVNGSNAARFALDWRDGRNNANARRINLNNLDLSGFEALSVVIYIKTRDTFEDPTDPTLFKLALQGANGAIWQTPTTLAPAIENESYATFTFLFSEMELIDGPGSIADALQNVANFRLRFENASGNNSRQDAFIDSVIAVSGSEVPEIEVPMVEISPAAGGVELHFATIAGQDYQIQRSADLATWESDGEVVVGSGQPVSRLYATGAGREFFRVLITRN